MRKLSIPMTIDILNDDNMYVYLDELKKAKADRVFLTISSEIYRKNNLLDKDPELIKKAITFYKNAGLEVGIWIDAFGHGGVLSHQDNIDPTKTNFTSMEGIDGSTCDRGFCPLDRNFREIYFDSVKRFALMDPDLIMLDDDFRMNARGGVYMACFCERHLEMYYEKIGERISRCEIEEKILTGGKNKYRTAYLELVGETLAAFAKDLREELDKVNDKVRLGCCVCYDNWDVSPDPIAYTLAFAGKTKPFMRTIGAPYWNSNVINVIENTRMQLIWCKDKGIELFSEGDSYPRPRYHVEAKRLENFDLALIADGRADGILKYMIDYSRKPDYEKGYIELHSRYEKLREEVSEIFKGKTPVGVYSYNALHKNADAILPDTLSKGRMDVMLSGYKCSSSELLSKNSIVTSHLPSGYPVFVCGENARQMDLDLIGKGAILDVPAAEILKSRGVDVGLVSSEDARFRKEIFRSFDDFIPVSGRTHTKKLVCSEKVDTVTVFEDGSPASYMYENKNGQRFFVLPFDVYADDDIFNVDSHMGETAINYYRQAELKRAIEWIGGKKLPAFVEKAPNLYILSSKDDEKMSVLLINHFMDEVFDPIVELDKSYSNIRFINCNGRLEGDKVYLDTIPAYGTVAFEIK